MFFILCQEFDVIVHEKRVFLLWSYSILAILYPNALANLVVDVETIMSKLVPALTIQHIIPCMNSTEPLEMYMLPGQMEEKAWPNSRPLPLLSK